MSLKKEIFLKLDKLTTAETLLATNTSSLSISEIANVTNNPGRVIGMHFFNPVPIMKLLEIIRHDKCTEKTIRAAESIGSELGKTTILVNDFPGFADVNDFSRFFPTTLAVLGILSSCPRVMTMQCWKSQIPPPLSTRLRVCLLLVFWFCADQKERNHDLAKFPSKIKTQRQVKS